MSYGLDMKLDVSGADGEGAAHGAFPKRVVTGLRAQQPR
jgi:hypothetical protein